VKVIFDELSIKEQRVSARVGDEAVTPLLSLALSGELDLPLPGLGVVSPEVITDLEALESSLRQRGAELTAAADKLEQVVAGLRPL